MFVTLESAMARLDEAGVEYQVRVQGPEGTILKDPKAPSEKGKWKTLIYSNLKTGSPMNTITTGDFVQMVVNPAGSSPAAAAPAPAPTPPPAPVTRKVTYVITSDGPILSTTFGNTVAGSMSTEQANNVASPFVKEYSLSTYQFEHDFTFFSASAQAGEGATTISCQINYDGLPGPVSTSTGPYAVVMCTR